MTPQPTGGYYKTSGVEDFVRKYGYTERQKVGIAISCFTCGTDGRKDDRISEALGRMGRTTFCQFLLFG